MSTMRPNESAVDLHSWNHEYKIAESNLEKCSLDPVVAAATAKLIAGMSNDPFYSGRVVHRLPSFSARDYSRYFRHSHNRHVGSVL